MYICDDDEHPIFIDIQEEKWRAALPESTRLEEYMRAACISMYQALPQCLIHLEKNIMPGCSILLTSDHAVRELNRDFRGIDKTTDVLSFPSEERTPPDADQPFNADYLGDIAIAYETVMRDAAALQIHPDHHTKHLLLHAILHLLGYDHETNEHDACVMEDKERKILKQYFDISDPYAHAE